MTGQRELAIWPEGTGWRVKIATDLAHVWASRGPLHPTADAARAYALELDRAGRGHLPRKVKGNPCT